MAKRYDAPDDVERDYLRQHARVARHKMQVGFDDALMGGLVATASQTAQELNELQASVSKKPVSGFYTGLNKFLMWAGVVTGVIGIIKWWTNRTEAIKTEGRLSGMGPEEIVYPPIADMIEAEQSKHRDRLQQEVASKERSF